MDNVWSPGLGRPFYAVNGGGIPVPMEGYNIGQDYWPGCGLSFGPGQDCWPGFGSGFGSGQDYWGPGYGPGFGPGHGPCKPPKKPMDCQEVLRCIRRCLSDYTDYKPCERSIEAHDFEGGYEIGPVAGYGWGYNAPL